MLAINYGADGAVVMQRQAGRLPVSGRPGVPRARRGNGDARLQRARIHLERRPGRAPEDAEAARGGVGKLRLVGVSRHLRDIFLYSGFDQIFEIEPAR